ncbi:MAG TPA: flavin reductase family protein [Caulobacteraceae bacterium]|jgi:3-hydroxy-9,10-secoandrosta-1,3,5(10)-triene-9,17-dione monooxygenase reductase component|nr:flavin reductase family protein [Caulobacteraceae bacterium]
MSGDTLPVPTPTEWRMAMGFFPTGVTIVTTWDGDEPVGSTINAFCSVSLDPPLLLICLDLKNPIREAFERSRVFGVNILCEDGRPIAQRFAREPLTDRFVEFAYQRTPGGAPQLLAAPVFIDCAVQDIHPAGDHLIAVGRGLRVEHAAGVAPLVYHRGQFPRVDPMR